MKKKRLNCGVFLKAVSASAVSALFFSVPSLGAADEHSPSRKPNIVVILTDDHGFADLSCQGQLKDIKTPNIDSLARDGVRITNGYVTAPQCIPSRAGILTGRYQQRFGLEDNASIPLPLNETTLAQRMQKAGYVTGMVGKWHLEPNHTQIPWIKEHMPEADLKSDRPVAIPGKLVKPYLPTARGFSDTFSGEMQRYWATHDLQGKQLAEGGEYVQEKSFRLDVQSKAAVNFIDRNHEKPFFLYLAYYGPHVPLEATEKYLSRFPGKMPERRRYALAMLSAVDDGVGEVRQALQKHGIDKDTLIFFLSDNGAPLGMGMHDTPISEKKEAWDGSRNDPMIGEKGMLSEGGIHIPFIATWPGKLPAGKLYTNPVISLDIAATAVALSGQPASPELDGTNIVPYLTGEKADQPHQALFWRFWNQAAVRKGKWKYLQAPGEQRFLFDLESAEQEHKNLIADHPDIAKELAADLAQWAGTLKNPGIPTGEPKGGEKRWYEYYFGPIRKN